jgi:predicted glycoside hydrolase/deacetylase ChbG (UPF0249 family)
MKRKIIINADDIGMHPAVDHAAIALAETGVLTSVSVMSLGNPLSDAIRIFRGYGVDIGLHLDLTSDMANRRYGTDATIKSMIVQSYRGQLNLPQLRDIVRDQIERFAEHVGMLPAFIDGHEHVHQLPMVRDALMDVLDEMSANYRPYLRNTTPRCWRGAKAASNGQMTLSPLSRELCFEDKTVRLSAKEFSLMQSLLLRPGTILSRQELEDRIYGWNEEVESNVIEYLIHSIRKKVDSKIIINVRGLGWMVSKEN